MKRRRKRRRMNPNTALVIRQVLIGVMIFSFLGLLISSIWYVTRLDSLTLDSVDVSGGETISHEEVRQIAWSKLQGTYLNLVPRVFALTYPEKKIIEELSTVDRIKNIVVTRVGGKKLLVTFGEYVPEALWCKTDTNEACVFIDEDGYAFSTAPQLTGGAFMRYSTTGVDPEIGKVLLESEEYETLIKLVVLLSDAGWYVSHVDIDAAKDVYLEVINGGELKATLTQAPIDTVNNLLTILQSEEFSHIAPGNFKYIDLRFGNKVFVNEVLTPPEEDVVEEELFTIDSPESNIETATSTEE